MKLSGQAVQLLEQLDDREEMTVEELEKEGYDQSMVHRAALELQENGLADYEEEEEVVQVLTDKGRKVIEEGSPEHRLASRLESGPEKMSDLEDLDLDIALGKARQKGWVEIESGEVELTEKGEKNLESDPVSEKLGNENFDGELVDRGLVSEEASKRRTIKLTEKGKALTEEEIEEDFNVEARVKTPRTGKKHFYKEIIDYANRTWRDLGFREMEGEFIVPGLLNFDALYIPQDHPAREMQDTFFMERPRKSSLSSYREETRSIKATHENGWETGSTGWGYNWSEKEAERNVLRTHTTAASARKLAELEEDDLPAKFYTTSRVFRNETVDRHHLAEFFQSDGIVVGKDLSFRNLKGYISEFFERMGFDEFRLVPTYYPYTEMSAEVHVWDEKGEEWIALGGSGMFRPEVVKPLLGFEATVLAWGLGIPRIAMRAAELEDIRELYRNDIEILEGTPAWRPENGGKK
ncbi:MAG: phenylalanine--tRNA ligase subunit alpha [Candidatus Nanohaloarchaea archaeon]